MLNKVQHVCKVANIAAQFERMPINRARRRERGHPTEAVGFRCPEELIGAAKSLDRDLSKGMIRMLDRANDAARELGDLWIEVEILAHREGITEGEALGRLARDALKRQKR